MGMQPEDPHDMPDSPHGFITFHHEKGEKFHRVPFLSFCNTKLEWVRQGERTRTFMLD
jgi:hypothetical protein